MGTGIMGVIPIKFSIELGRYEKDGERNLDGLRKHMAAGFFELYDKSPCVENEYRDRYYPKWRDLDEDVIADYTIKSDVLLSNFKRFYHDFHQLIRNDRKLERCKKFNDEYERLVETNNFS